MSFQGVDPGRSLLVGSAFICSFAERNDFSSIGFGEVRTAEMDCKPCLLVEVTALITKRRRYDTASFALTAVVSGVY
jgi:hypothetical protein